MDILTTYKAKIKEEEFKTCFMNTVEYYRKAVDFFIDVAASEWDWLALLSGTARNNFMEFLCVQTLDNPAPKYNFTKYMYKFPCYYRRAAISEALGKVSSYKSNMANWEQTHNGKKPGYPRAGFVYPSMYRGNTFELVEGEPYQARLKVWIRNTWDWVTVTLRKSDMDYIHRHCASHSR